MNALYAFSRVCVSDEVDTFKNQSFTLRLLCEVMLIVLDTSVWLTVVEEIEFGVVESFWKSLNQAFDLYLISVFNTPLFLNVEELQIKALEKTSVFVQLSLTPSKIACIFVA